MKNVLFITFIFASTIAFGQDFGLLRQNDDISGLDTIENKNIYQKIKYIVIAKNTTISFGGSWRFQTESYINQDFQSNVPQDYIWFFNRFLLHSHLKVKDKFEVFGELGSSIVSVKNDPSPVDKDQLYLNQLFATYNISPNWNISAGRKNMRLGSGRLIDVREGPNVRRLFDFAETNIQNGKFKAELFFTVPVKSVPGLFDNEYLKFDETFSGIYTTVNFSEATNFDTYLLFQKDDNATYNNVVGNERRASVGIRQFGTYKKWNYNNEAVYQFGEIDGQQISAWTLSLNVERAFKSFNLGIKTEAISGDKTANDNRLNTFDAMYPRGAYFGRVAKFGPSNLLDIHPYINAKFKKLEVELDYDAFWRYSIADGIYGAPMTLDYPDTNDEKFIAQQVGIVAGYELNKFIFIELESNIIFPGNFLRTSNLSDKLYHFVLTTEFKF